MFVAYCILAPDCALSVSKCREENFMHSVYKCKSIEKYFPLIILEKYNNLHEFCIVNYNDIKVSADVYVSFFISVII